VHSSLFYRYFLIVSGATALCILGSGQLSLFKPFLLFSFICLFLFMGLTMLMFYIGSKTATSSNKGLFTGVILGFTFGKILLSLFVVLSYHHFGNPPSKIFLLTFFLIYLIFTIFETYVMMQIGQHSQTSTNG